MIVAGAVALDARDDYEAADRLDEDAKERGLDARLATNVLIGIGAAAAVAAVAFAIYDLKFKEDETGGEAPPETESSAGPSVGFAPIAVPGGGGMAVVGEF